MADHANSDMEVDNPSNSQEIDLLESSEEESVTVIVSNTTDQDTLRPRTNDTSLAGETLIDLETEGTTKDPVYPAPGVDKAKSRTQRRLTAKNIMSPAPSAQSTPTLSKRSRDHGDTPQHGTSAKEIFANRSRL